MTNSKVKSSSSIHSAKEFHKTFSKEWLTRPWVKFTTTAGSLNVSREQIVLSLDYSGGTKIKLEMTISQHSHRQRRKQEHSWDWRSKPRSTTTATASLKEKVPPISASSCKPWTKRSTKRSTCGDSRTRNSICSSEKNHKINDSNSWIRSSLFQNCRYCRTSKCKSLSKPKTLKTYMTSWTN